MINAECSIMNIKKNEMITILDDFLSLIYPQVCASCGKTLYKNEKIICTFCNYHLPKTNFHLEKNNPVSEIFWGRVNIESAAACFYFSKGSKIQHLIHQFKYKGKKEIGIYLGKQYGLDLMDSPLFSSVDLVIPVPLHRIKQKKRGYNQSEQFAMGISQSMKIKMDTKLLYRKTASQTQTKKSRFKRWENVSEIFDVKQSESFQVKHILLVDDVITTGSTIEACANALYKIPNVRISVATIAFAVN